VYKSIFKIFKKKDSLMREESNYLLSTRGEQISPADVQKENVEKCSSLPNHLRSTPDVREQAGYLPDAYNSRDDEPQDFAREMVLSHGRCCQFDPSSESPVSLASAFRRTMSPTASSCAGSDLSGVQALINVNHTNVAQHVGWLQGHFQSPKAVDKTKSNEGMNF